jgi:hypothetical protein
MICWKMFLNMIFIIEIREQALENDNRNSIRISAGSVEEAGKFNGPSAGWKIKMSIGYGPLAHILEFLQTTWRSIIRAF